MQKLAIILIIATLYFIFGKLSQFLFPDSLVIPVWPPSGIALAGVLIFGEITLVGIFIGALFSNLHMFTGQGLTPLAIIYACIPGIGAALQAYVGKLALVGFAGTDNLFKNTLSITIFILMAAFIASMIGATIGAGTLVLTRNIPLSDFAFNWVTWWISDAVGIVAVTPTIIAWYYRWHEKIPKSQIMNVAITWFLILIFSYIAFNVPSQIAYLFIPFAIWAAFQFDIKFSLLTGLLIAFLCFFGERYEYGLIQTHTFGYAAILHIQIFISIIFLTILLLDTILSDRQKAYKALQALNVQLEQRVLDRTKDLSESNQQLEMQKNKLITILEELKQSHARLMQSEKMASLGLLTAGVAHEIKNPLNAMSANMASIKTNIDDMINIVSPAANPNVINEVNGFKEKTTNLIAATNEGIKRTAGVISDLCAFARADETEMVETDIHQNIDSTLNLLSSEIRNNIKIIKEYGDIPLIPCHPGKINQVIMNILINAIHALQSKADGKIVIKTNLLDDTIMINIQDNGPGMKQEVVDKIFVPFFTTKRDGMGSGLGLFISSNIVKEHNGTISVKSEIGKGTEFSISLPVKGV